MPVEILQTHKLLQSCEEALAAKLSEVQALAQKSHFALFDPTITQLTIEIQTLQRTQRGNDQLTR